MSHQGRVFLACGALLIFWLVSAIRYEIIPLLTQLDVLSVVHGIRAFCTLKQVVTALFIVEILPAALLRERTFLTCGG